MRPSFVLFQQCQCDFGTPLLQAASSHLSMMTSYTFHPCLFLVEQDQVWSITPNPDEDLAEGQAR